jgi:hypothetical protein
MADDALPYEIQADEGIAVTLPSGATYYVHTDGEEHYLRDKITRYLSDNHFVNISDMQEIDRMITFELLIHRWSMWLARGKDYWNDPINTKQYSDMVQDYSREVRQLKKALGVDKTSRDKTRGDDSIAALWDNLLRRAREFGYMRNEQMVQVITSFHRIKAMITLHKNCLAGDTKVITKFGVRRLDLIEGEIVEFLDGHGGWTSAKVQSYGEQPVHEIHLERAGQHRTIEATADHRWYARKRTADGATREVATTALRSGDRLVSLYGRGPRAEPSPWGAAHGIVFGDGHASVHPGSGSEVRLCGPKAVLLKWFPLSPTRTIDGDPVVTGLPAHWKQLPELYMDVSYLLGWLCGYLATDGSVDEHGAAKIDSVDPLHVLHARDVAIRIGIPTCGVSSHTAEGGYGTTTMWRIRFPVGAFGPDMMLRPEHRDRHKSRAKRLPDWKVTEVRHTGKITEVFCPTVSTTGSFVLEGNLLTGNCDAIERKENACELSDVLEVIEDEIAKFDAIDEKFRFEKQALWVRSQ